MPTKHSLLLLSLRFITVLLLTLAQPSYADSIPTFTTQANISFSTNFGGDNQFSIFQGQNVSLGASGSANCFWCLSANLFLTPGSSINPSIDFLGWVAVNGSVTIGNQGYGCEGQNCVLYGVGLTALKTFAFPTNGRNFTITVPAVIEGLISGQLDNGQLFNLETPPGNLVLTFDFVPGGPSGSPAYYQFSQGVFRTPGFQPVPEPGTLVLIGTGITGMLALIRKRKED